jgi:hypothetical protein
MASMAAYLDIIDEDAILLSLRYSIQVFWIGSVLALTEKCLRIYDHHLLFPVFPAGLPGALRRVNDESTVCECDGLAICIRYM